MTKEEAIAKSDAIGGLMSREEKEALWDLADKYILKGGIALEVGTWTGGSAVILGEVCQKKGARLICIDAFSADMHSTGEGVRSDAFGSVLKNCAGLPIDYMCGNSINFVPYLAENIIDFAFIDGKHTYPEVKLDIEGYWRMLRPAGGYMIHDYGNPCDVKDVVDFFFGENKVKHIDSSVFVEKAA